ncbi:MAG: S9 family peptidase [Acidipila sp.]|nr:S9 family peptidase [Acidipila sp.]
MKRWMLSLVGALFIFGLSVGAPCVAGAQSKRAISFGDLVTMHRVAESQVSPDGKLVAYTVATPDMEANRLARDLWVVAVAGGEPKQLTRSGHESGPRWSPDSKRIAFLSSRDGAAQIYVIAEEGGEAAKIAGISTGADNLLWSPDGKTFAFTSEVYLDCKDDACNQKRDAEREKSKVKARIYEHLLYRHWTHFSEGKRSHLFAVAATGGAARDLTPEADYDVPPFSLGGPDELAFSPDGKEICFTANADKEAAISTNGDLFVVPVDGSAAPKRITTNPGFDGGAVYSPDGKTIAYHAQLIAAYEADRWRLMLYDRASGKHTNLSENFDRSVDTIAWAPDGKSLYFTAEDRGVVAIFNMAAAAGSEPKGVVRLFTVEGFGLTPDGKTLIFTQSSLQAPAEVFAAAAENGSGVRQLTRHNAERLAQLDLPAAEHFWFDASDKTKIHAMLVRPPAFDAAKKYPLLLIAHGGPQTMWHDGWSYRWNPEVLASPGYVVLLINRRGSTGFGQKFTDEIQDDWGGKAYTDLIHGTDFALKKYPFIDGNRMAAAGASYGGFMMDWFESQTKGRFKSIISHAGVYNQESEYGATEELWFPEHEMRGTPWSNPAAYEKWSPKKYAAEFGKYKTPTLVICGELDYRVPYTQSLEFFTALQRQGVPSKLLIFPDEGHWILKPQNSELWHKTVLDWLAIYLK